MLLLFVGCSNPSSPPVSEADADVDTDADACVPEAERCDGRDNDCDGVVPAEEVDADGDGALDCAACDAEGFWEPTLGLSGDALRQRLNELTAGHSCVSYPNEREWMFVTLDKMNGSVECVYTGRTTPVGNTEPDPTDMNTEHTWPQSLGADTEPARCDVHHLYPVDADANSRRGNSPYGNVVDVVWQEGGSKLGDDASGARVFEPRAAHKGNAARSILYFGMRYGYDVEPAYRDVLKAWSTLDPPDEREIERTLQIRDRLGKANPFVVCPQLVDRL
ncbi:MAG: endonuclease [Myxococcota bacterium]